MTWKLIKNDPGRHVLVENDDGDRCSFARALDGSLIVTADGFLILQGDALDALKELLK
jgi:hypothetical protein